MDSYQAPRSGSIFLRGTRLCLRLPCPEEAFHSLQYLLQTALLAFGHARVARLSIDRLDEQFEHYSAQISFTFRQIRCEHGDKVLNQVFWLWLHTCLKAEREWKDSVHDWRGDLEVKEDLIALGYAVSFCFDAIKILSSEALLPAYSKSDNLPNYCGCSAHSGRLESSDILTQNEEVILEPPVIPSQGGVEEGEAVAGVRESSSPPRVVYESNMTTISPDQFIPGIPLDDSSCSMEREVSPFLQPDSSAPDLNLSPRTAKEKEILFRMHQELAYAEMEAFEPEVNYHPQIIIQEGSSHGTPNAAMSKSRTRSAPSFVYGPFSSTPSSASTSATPSTSNVASTSTSTSTSGAIDSKAATLDRVSDEELLHETRRRRDNYLQARMRLAEQVSTRYKRPNTLRRTKSSDSLRSIDGREGIAPTRCYAYGRGGLKDVRISPFSPSRLPLNQSLKECSTPISNDPSRDGGFDSDAFQRWLELPTPENFHPHGLERPDWILAEPFSQPCSPCPGFPTPSLDSNF